jgi:hypothetical protein
MTRAQAESFFSRFKAELIEGGVFEDLEQARSEIFSYIEAYYNRVRLHSSLGYKSPLEFEMKLKTKNGGNKRQFFCLKKLDHLRTISLDKSKKLSRCISTLLFGLLLPIPCCGSGFKLVTLLAGLYCPKSLPTLTPFLVCNLRKVSQTSYADSFACITTC